MSRSTWSRWFRRTPRTIAAGGPGSRRKRRSSLAVERLEDRTVPTLNFGTLASGLEAKLNQLDAALDTVGPIHHLPIVNQPLTAIQEANDAFKTIKSAFHLTDLSQLDPSTTNADDLQDFLFTKLTSGPINLLGDLNADSQITEDDVIVDDFDANAGNVTVTLRLTKDIVDGTPASADFGLGLPAVPFLVTSQGDVQVRVGFDYHNFTFSLTNNVLELKTTDQADKEFTLTVDATLRPDTATTPMTGLFGFLPLNAITDDPVHPTSFHGDFHIDVIAGPNPLSDPRLTGAADVHLQLNTAFGGGTEFPDFRADLAMHWSFTNAPVNVPQLSDFGDALPPSLDLQNIEVNIGSYLSEFVGPGLERLKKILEPVQPALEKLRENVDAISELTGEDTSLVDLAVGLGLVPPEVDRYLALLDDVIVVTNNIPTVLTAVDGVYLPLIDNLSLGGVQDLRSLPSFEWLQPDLTQLGFQGSSPLDYADVKAQILANVPNSDPVKPSVQNVLDFFDKDLNAHFQISLPILTNTGDVVAGLFLGQDSDLFHITADFTLDHHGGFGPYAIPIGIVTALIDLDSDLHIEAHVGLGYDTAGIREFGKQVYDQFVNSGPTASALVLLNGLYLDTNTHANITVGVHGDAYLISPAEYVHGGADVAGDLSLWIDPAWDADSDAKFRIFVEAGDCLFATSGLLTADANVEAAVTIATPLGPILYIETWSMPTEVLIDWTGGCIANPFTATDPKLAEFDPNVPGLLWLNVGPRAANRNVEQNVINEVYTVTPLGDVDDAVVVSAFGLYQTFEGVTKIIADAGTGTDLITIADGVKAEIELYGGADNDQLKQESSGYTELYGDDGDDVLFGGGGDNFLFGGIGNDQIQGGTGINHAWGLDGDDELHSGSGPSHFFGGTGKDDLFAGPQDDYLDGEGDDDRLFGHGGADDLHGGTGNDLITWHVAPGAPVITVVDGGAGNDSLTVYATDQPDTITADPFGPDGVKVVTGDTTVQAAFVEGLNIEALGGADLVTINYLQDNVAVVSVNLVDAVWPDAAASDLVIVNARPIPDLLTVEAVPVDVFDPFGPDKPDDPLPGGGVMTVAGETLPYLVQAANFADHLRVNALEGLDRVTVRSISGPTTINGGGNGVVNDGDDIINVEAKSAADYYPGSPLYVDAGQGSNTLNVSEADATADTIYLSSTRVWSGLLPGVNYIATGGNYGGGVNLMAGAFADTIKVQSTLFGATTSVNTGGGNDLVIVTSMSGDLAGIGGVLAIDAGAGAGNVLKVSDVAATTGNQNVRVTPTQILGFAGPADATSINYQATNGQLSLTMDGSDTAALAEQFRVQNPTATLVLNANGGNDSVVVEALGTAATINGGAGDDVVIVGDANNTLNSETAPLTVNGDAGSDRLFVNDFGTAAGQTYTIGATTVARSGAGTISHGTAEFVTVRSGNFADLFFVTGMPTASVNLTAGQGSDTVVGPAFDSVWNVLAADGGTLNTTVGLYGFEQLIGSSARDRFVFKEGVAFTGTVNGGAGEDTLDYSGFSHNVRAYLATNVATAVGGSAFNFEDAVGGNGDDVFLGTTGNNIFHGGEGNDILVGNDGADVLWGEGGRDILIGGLGADQVYGGTGDDIVIGGKTTHDGNVPALLALLSEWVTLGGYTTRVNHLRTGGGLNGAVLLNAGTVIDDGIADILKGQEDVDWFWANPALDLTDKTAGEFTN